MVLQCYILFTMSSQCRRGARVPFSFDIPKYARANCDFSLVSIFSL